MEGAGQQKSTDSSLEKLCELFSKMLNQQQVNTISPEVMKQHTLEPNPVKLSGPKNYISWARHAQLILSSHDYESLLTRLLLLLNKPMTKYLCGC